MFICPKCDGKTEVYASKKEVPKYTVGRYRRCLSCGLSFVTIERLLDADEEIYPNVRKERVRASNNAYSEVIAFAQGRMKGTLI